MPSERPGFNLGYVILRAAAKTAAMAVGLLVLYAALRWLGDERGREILSTKFDRSASSLIFRVLQGILIWFMILFVPTLIVAYPFSILTRNAEARQTLISGIGLGGLALVLLLLRWPAADSVIAVTLTLVGGAYGGLYALFFILERERSLRL